MQFEFDPAKSASNKAKHGLDFIEAQALWTDACRMRVPAKIIGGEVRYAVLGSIGRVLHTVIVTYRGACIRIISARPSSPAEKQNYEQHKNKVP